MNHISRYTLSQLRTNPNAVRTLWTHRLDLWTLNSQGQKVRLVSSEVTYHAWIKTVNRLALRFPDQPIFAKETPLDPPPDAIDKVVKRQPLLTTIVY